MGKHIQQDKGLVYSIEPFALDDGPGIRTLVFFKGCPLRCIWCSNPEGQLPVKEIAIFAERCMACGTCEKVCIGGAAFFTKEGTPAIHQNKCKKCGTCINFCLTGARKGYGVYLTEEEVFKQISTDLHFYRRSGGGVTLSGGEPLMQWNFARKILKLCNSAGIQTALETCGHYPWKHLESCLPYLNNVFFDIKHMDPQGHKKITGKDNRLILRNARNLFEQKVNTIVRIPIIPGINDDSENIIAMARFLRTFPEIKIELMPYHSLGVSKYWRMNKKYSLTYINSPGKEQLNRLCKLFEAEGNQYVRIAHSI